jgi:hypothetical protein
MGGYAVGTSFVHKCKVFVGKHRVAVGALAGAALALVVTALVAALLFGPGSAQPTPGGGEILLQEFDPDEPMGAGLAGVRAEPEGTDAPGVALPGFDQEEINRLKEELSDTHAALLKANAEYAAEKAAREADMQAAKVTQGRLAGLESEKNKLLSDLRAKEAELEQKTPPRLDMQLIIGSYEGYGELVTLTYSYEVMEEYRSTGNIFTNKTVLYAIPGTLKIGVDFDAVKNSIRADDIQKTVTVTIPAAYFVSNEIDENNVERYDVSRGMFSKVEDKDYLSVAPDAKKKAQEQVVANGMLEYAQRLAGMEVVGLTEPVTSRSGYRLVVEYGR